MRERAPAPPPGLFVCATAGSSINKIQIDGFSGNKAVFNLTCCCSISRCSSRMSVSRSGRRSLFWCDPHTMKKKLKKKKKDLQPVHQTNSFCKWPLRATTGCPVASVPRRTDVMDAGHWTQPQEHFVVWQFVLFLFFFFLPLALFFCYLLWKMNDAFISFSIVDNEEQKKQLDTDRYWMFFF